MSKVLCNQNLEPFLDSEPKNRKNGTLKPTLNFHSDKNNNNNNVTQNGNGRAANGVKHELITYALFEDENEKIVEVIEEIDSKSEENSDEKVTGRVPYIYVWRNILGMSAIHIGALIGLGLITQVKALTLSWTFLILVLGSLGVQAGAHRLWAHKTYKANFGVRLFLSLCHVLALQNDIYEWSRDHRAHHKFADTDADPHDSSKGFFFSHMGWLLVKKHPEVKRRGKAVYMDDLLKDPIVVFQKKWYIPMVAIFWGAIPTFVPVLFWKENIIYSFFLCVAFRYCLSLNLTWLVNSWSHLYGYRPYDSKLPAVESTVRHLLMGEGFHNYHHAFPWDYSASELGWTECFNPCTAAIDFFHWMGWAWDLKKVPKSMVEARMKRTGNPDDYYYYKPSTPAYEWITGLASCLTIFYFLRFLQSFSTADTISY